MFLFITLLITSVCFAGDNILKIANNDVLKAVVDSVTHSVIAILCWLIVVLKCHKRSSVIINAVFELFLCGFIASAIDIDHFILAKSFKLKNALNLGKRRPLLHCTTVPVVLLVSCLAVSWIWDAPKVSRFGWIASVSFFTHQIRDSFRRGIWLWPFGSSPPIPYYLYLLLTLALPYLVIIPLREHSKKSLPSLSTTDYVTV